MSAIQKLVAISRLFSEADTTWRVGRTFLRASVFVCFVGLAGLRQRLALGQPHFRQEPLSLWEKRCVCMALGQLGLVINRFGRAPFAIGRITCGFF